MGRMIRSKVFILTVLFFALTFLAPLFATAATVVDSKVYSENGHRYYLIAGGDKSNPVGISWFDAESYAVNELGGHLVTINSSATQDWITSNFCNNDKFIWIGLTDAEIENKFTWVGTGEETKYFNWNVGEPNNWGDEDYVMMYSAN